MIVAMDKGNMQEARSHQDRLDDINARERLKAKRKENRKHSIEQVRREYANRDPNSDEERGGSASAPA